MHSQDHADLECVSSVELKMSAVVPIFMIETPALKIQEKQNGTQ